jgi:DNA-binding MarR family transcriptional regulator
MAKGGAKGQRRSGTGRKSETEGRAFDLENFLPYRLSVVTNQVSRAFARRYSAEFGLSIPEWRVVAVVGGFAPLSSNEICARTEMDKAKVSRAVTRLVSAGLLTRRPDPADQRLIRLAFTAKGRKVYDAIVPRARALERELTEALKPDERAALERALAKLSARVAPDE